MCVYFGHGLGWFDNSLCVCVCVVCVCVCVYVCVLVLALASLVIVCVVCHVFASMVSRLGFERSLASVG